MAKWLDSIEKHVGGEKKSTKSENPSKQVKVFRWLLLLGCIGALLMLLNNFPWFETVEVESARDNTSTQSEEAIFQQSKDPSSSFELIEMQLENRLKDILEKMVGVGKVDILVTVESTEEKIIEHNLSTSESVTDESDKNGGTRHMTTVTSSGQVVFMQSSGGQEPVVTKVINPRIRGVLIVAEGAEDAAVRKLITQAVEKGLNVSQTRISVAPSKK